MSAVLLFFFLLWPMMVALSRRRESLGGLVQSRGWAMTGDHPPLHLFVNGL